MEKLKVRVKETQQEGFVGFFDHARRRPGDVFSIPTEPRRDLFPKEKQRIDAKNEDAIATYDTIKDKDGKVPQMFSFEWMELVDARTPEKVSTAQQALTEKHDKLLEERAAKRQADDPAAAAGGTGNTEVI